MKHMLAQVIVLLSTVLLTILCIPNSGALCMGDSRSDLSALLPSTVDGWQSAPDDRFYDPGNLYDYIDGGAELFLSFGFRELISRTYVLHGQPEIVVDIFDMGSSRDAFGVFSHSREVIDSSFGQGSQYTGGLLLFWKNNYYVSILASPETGESKKSVSKLAEHIDSAISGEGPLPEILSLLPRESLVRESIRYFHHYIWLNSHYFIATDNILHIDEKTEAVLARYGENDTRHILLLVQYATPEDARKAHRDFIDNYLPEHTGGAENSGETKDTGETEYSEGAEHTRKTGNAGRTGSLTVEIEDGTWTGCRLNGSLLTAVLGAGSEKTALELIEKVEK